MITTYFVTPTVATLAQAIRSIAARRSGECSVDVERDGTVSARHGDVEVAAIVGGLRVGEDSDDRRDHGAVEVDGARWTVSTFGQMMVDRCTVVAFKGYAPETSDDYYEFPVPDGAIWICVTKCLSDGFYVKARVFA